MSTGLSVLIKRAESILNKQAESEADALVSAVPGMRDTVADSAAKTEAIKGQYKFKHNAPPADKIPDAPAETPKPVVRKPGNAVVMEPRVNPNPVAPVPGLMQQAQSFLAGMGRRGAGLYGQGRAALSSRIPEGVKAPVREFAGKARQVISSRMPQSAKDVIKNLTPGQKTAIMAMLGVGGVGAAMLARKAMKPKSRRSKR